VRLLDTILSVSRLKILEQGLQYLLDLLIITSPPGEVRSIAISMSMCLWVSLLGRVSQKPHVQTSRNFLYVLPVAVDQSTYVMYFRFCGSRYVFHIIGQIQIQTWESAT